MPTTRTPTFKPTVVVDNIAPPATTSKPSSKPSSLKPITAKPIIKLISSSPTTKPSTAKPTTQKPTTSSPTNNFPVVTLTTPLCSPTGNATTRQCWRQNGNMFSVDAKFNLNITSITVSVDSGTGVEVWTKTGEYIGFETNKNAWTRVGGKIHVDAAICTSLMRQFVTIIIFCRHLSTHSLS